MNLKAYKIVLIILHGLIKIKQGLFLFLGLNWKLILFLNAWYKEKIGFRLYKIYFYSIRKIKNKIFVPKVGFFETVGQRGFLQLFLLIILVLVTMPDSQFYKRDFKEIPGHHTLLYKLVGPGDQDFAIEEISVVPIQLIVNSNAGWKAGSIVSQPESDGKLKEPQDISAISAGGGAITKPPILTGVDIGSLNQGIDGTGRKEIIYHQVMAGEVVGKIAQDYNISVNTVLWANNLSARSYIRPGDKLKILPVDGLVYRVVKGDNVSKIAKKYGADVKKIIEFNKLEESGSGIKVGEELIIPGGEMSRIVYQTITNRPSAFDKITPPLPSINAPAGSGYLWPTNIKYISQYYGWRHTGLDIAGPTGSPLYASRAGEVVKSQCGYNGGYGCYIIINHGGGVQTLYGHASKLYVSVGDYVEQGQTIALMGSTGRSTGPHIHFEVRINGRRVNPLGYVRK